MYFYLWLVFISRFLFVFTEQSSSCNVEDCGELETFPDSVPSVLSGNGHVTSAGSGRCVKHMGLDELVSLGSLLPLLISSALMASLFHFLLSLILFFFFCHVFDEF